MNIEVSGFTVERERRRSELIIGKDIPLLKDLLPDRTVIVTDATVNRLYREILPPGIPRLVIPQGEGNKTLTTAEKLYRGFMKKRIDRSAFILGIGGGIVCDITGFAAATFMRGVSFAFAPTTLLAQVDASIGGKNGVNFLGFKNLVGTIEQPRFIFISPDFLATLAPRQLRCGFAEMIKTAAIADFSFFEFLEKNRKKLQELHRDALVHSISIAAGIKTAIVRRDEREAGERKKLNFGHTLGHALERSAAIPHGEAVSIGMAAAAAVSVKKGTMGQKDADRLIRLLQEFGLPVEFTAGWPGIRTALAHDKKISGNDIDMVLLHGLGNAEIHRIPITELRRCFYDLCMYRSNNVR